MGGFHVKPPSLDGTAETLTELAGALQAGRPEPAISGKVMVPVAHEDVARLTKDFAEFAQDQFEDVVALLAALSSQTKSVAARYTATDEAIKRTFEAFINDSTLREAYPGGPR
jgi:hypothetical protein